ncbi:MAG TPA: PLP-dependent aminotransferase family protein [Cellulomonas sp.]
MGTQRLGASDLSRLLGRWSSSDATLATSLADALVELIATGVLPAGARLPSQRALADALRVSRGTVTTAYEALDAAGHLATTHGSGSRVRSTQRWHHDLSGRLFSFTDTPAGVLDLSTGALPAAPVTQEVLDRPLGDLVAPYLATDGYFPAGVPALRAAVAERFTQDGVPTTPDEILITSGAQEATWLAVSALAGAGDVVLTEEPTYRGALEAVRSAGARAVGLRSDDEGIDPDHLRRSAPRAAALYCQTSIHNPTGRSTPGPRRRALAQVIDAAGLLTVEDACSADLTLHGPPVAPTLAGLVDPDLLLTIGTASKLFWGGLRIGWLRAAPDRIAGLAELRKPIDLATPVVDQLLVVRLVQQSGTAREQRRAMLTGCLAATEQVLREAAPGWTWRPVDGGSGLWVDTHRDTVALAEVAKRSGFRLAPGPDFSVHGGQGTHLRLPVWHRPEQLRAAVLALGARAG